jgi:hypothetical protein
MALIVEDGTGKPDAESYASVADTDAYFAARGVDAWAASSPSSIKEAALRNATEYLEIVYGASFRGQRANAEQALSWPRKNAWNSQTCDYWPDDIVPPQIINATMELAYISQTTSLFMAPVDPYSIVEEYRVKVGPVEEQKKFKESYSSYVTFPKVEMMLSGLTQVGYGQTRLVRG